MLPTRYYFTNEFDPYIDDLYKYSHSDIDFRKGMDLKKVSEKFLYSYLILEGFCKYSVYHSSGSEKVIGYWGPGSICPIVCTEQDFVLEYSLKITAITPMKTKRYDAKEIRKIIADHPKIAYEMIDHYGKYSNLLLFCLTTQTYENLRTRVCNMLYIFSQNSNSDEFPLSQKELASIIGANRQSVVKVLKELKEEQIILTNNKKIRILSIEKLLAVGSLLLK